MEINNGLDALRAAWQDVKPQIPTVVDAKPPLIETWQPLDFIKNYFYLYDTEDIISLHPSQEYPLAEAMSRLPDGRFKYHTVLWSWPKKSAKSSIVAAAADYNCLFKAKSSWKLIGNDLKQADSRVGHYMRENIKIGQSKGYGNDAGAIALQNIRKATKISVSNYKIVYPNRSVVEMIPIDAAGEAGGNDDGTVYSELWGWRHKSHKAMWTEQTISSNRFGYAQRWIDTYAGFEGESEILENLYKNVVSPENKLDIPHNDECYAANGIFACWVTKHHLPWQVAEYYESEKSTMHESEFNRIHLNQWGQSEQSFVDIKYWDACADDRSPNDGGILPHEKHDEIVIALDAAVTNDCFAIVAISRDKRYPPKYNADGEQISPEYFVRRYARAWYPPKDGKIQFDGEDSPKSELKRLIKLHNVYCVTYDPYQLHHFVTEAEKELDTFFEEFPQGTQREIADKMLLDIIREKRFAHDGKDNELRTHILNSGAKIIGEDKRLRIIKKHPSKKIDLTVAMSMAAYQASQILPK